MPIILPRTTDTRADRRLFAEVRWMPHLQQLKFPTNAGFLYSIDQEGAKTPHR
jgi:hypothetical protein